MLDLLGAEEVRSKRIEPEILFEEAVMRSGRGGGDDDRRIDCYH